MRIRYARQSGYFTALTVIIAVLVSAIGSGCSNSACTENRNAVPLAAFLDSSTGKAISLDSICITGVSQPNDSILSEAGETVSQVYLPMRPTHESVAWCMAYKWRYLDFDELNDTITFDYKSIPYFASEECGAYYRYDITKMSYTTHLIDSVTIVDSLVTNIDKVYVNIYFRVNSES